MTTVWARASRCSHTPTEPLPLPPARPPAPAAPPGGVALDCTRASGRPATRLLIGRFAASLVPHCPLCRFDVNGSTRKLVPPWSSILHACDKATQIAHCLCISEAQTRNLQGPSSSSSCKRGHARPLCWWKVFVFLRDHHNVRARSHAFVCSE